MEASAVGGGFGDLARPRLTAAVLAIVARLAIGDLRFTAAVLALVPRLTVDNLGRLGSTAVALVHSALVHCATDRARGALVSAFAVDNLLLGINQQGLLDTAAALALVPRLAPASGAAAAVGDRRLVCAFALSLLLRLGARPLGIVGYLRGDTRAAFAGVAPRAHALPPLTNFVGTALPWLRDLLLPLLLILRLDDLLLRTLSGR